MHRYSLYNLKFKNQFLIAMFIAPIILLTLLNIVVGITPINNENEVKLAVSKLTGSNYLNILDRSFTERYGDVLSFSQNYTTISEVSKKQYSPLLCKQINQIIQNYPVYDLILVVDNDGQLIACNSVDNNGNQLNTSFLFSKSFINNDWFEAQIDSTHREVFYSDLKLSPYTKRIYNSDGLGIGFSNQIRNSKDEIIGVWFNLASWSKITSNIGRQTIATLNKTYDNCEMVLTNKDGKIIDATNDKLLFKNLKQSVSTENEMDVFIDQKKYFSSNYYNIGIEKEKGIDLYKGQGWKSYVLIPKSKVNFNLFLTPTLLWIDLIALIFTALIAILFSKSLTSRVENVKNVVEKLSSGDTENIKIQIYGNDEIKGISDSFMKLADNLIATSLYANEIGKGNFKSKFEPLSENDKLGKALNLMAEDLYISDSKLKEEKSKAEHASMVKSQFLSTMSHELRTPLNAVIGMTNVLLQEEPRPDQLENLSIMKFSANNLLAIISDILDFNKMDAGKIELEDIPFNLKSLIKNYCRPRKIDFHKISAIKRI